MESMWNSRYGTDEYVYGIHPNAFFKNEISKITPGIILLPAEGEGRNAVYAATLGWEVYAFDFSDKAREKALQLVKTNKVNIQYEVHNFEKAAYENEFFDAMALIYAHSTNREDNHRRLLNFLKPGGTVILEGFSKAQLGNNTGGPKNIDMLFSIDALKNDFSSLREMEVWEEDIFLDEGSLHQGKASVVRLIGKK